MELTWEVIFYILGNIKNMRQSNIAKRLSISDSTVSRIKKGQFKKFYFSVDELYDKLFLPDHVNEQDLKEEKNKLLIRLKEILVKKDLNEDLNYFEEENDYETFVKRMLLATINNSTQAEKHHENHVDNFVFEFEVDFYSNDITEIDLDGAIVEAGVSSTPPNGSPTPSLMFGCEGVAARDISVKRFGIDCVFDFEMYTKCKCSLSFNTKKAIEMWYMEYNPPAFKVVIVDKRVDLINKKLSSLHEMIVKKQKENKDCYFEKKRVRFLNMTLNKFKHEIKVKELSVKFYLADNLFHMNTSVESEKDLLLFIGKILKFPHFGWVSPDTDYYNKYEIYLNPAPAGCDRSFFAYISNEFIKQITNKGKLFPHAGFVNNGNPHGIYIARGNKLFMEEVAVWFYKFLAEQFLNGKDIDSDERVRYLSEWQYVTNEWVHD